MNWEVEYTDEFDQWWSGLTEEEQVSLAASVQLLEERDQTLVIRTAVASMAQSTATCVNSGPSTKANHIELCMRLIHFEMPSCS